MSKEIFEVGDTLWIWNDANEKPLQYKIVRQISDTAFECMGTWEGADASFRGLGITTWTFCIEDMCLTREAAIKVALAKENNSHVEKINNLNEWLDYLLKNSE